MRKIERNIIDYFVKPLHCYAVCRSDRAAKKRALVDFNADDNQEGVMDRLN